MKEDWVVNGAGMASGVWGVTLCGPSYVQLPVVMLRRGDPKKKKKKKKKSKKKREREKGRWPSPMAATDPGGHTPVAAHVTSFAATRMVP